MKTFLKIAAVALSLFTAAPTIGQVRWGVDIHLGTPPPPRREIIIERPYPDAVWEPGYYNHYGRRYTWVPGRWRRPVYVAPPPPRRYGWNREWRHEREERREWRREGDRDYDDGYRHGRIR